MTTLEQMNLSQPLTDVYTAMETDLMLAIARQLAEGGEINATSEWRLKKLAEAGALSKETVQIIASYTGIQSDLITEAIEGAAMGVADRLEPALQACARDGYISAVGRTPISTSVGNVVTNFRKQAKTDLNLVNTVMQYKAGSAYKNLVNQIYDETKRQELLGVLGKHTLEVASGGESRQTAVRNCIKEFSQKGIPAFVDKRGREWSPEAYINMDIRTTVNNTANAAQDACCDRYGLDLIQISSHMGARPKCAIDQGKLYSRSNRSGIAHDGDGNEIPFYPWSSTSYGQPDGILGINCHHHKYPFADGVNFQRYFPYDKDENEERYKEFQKQRAMERRVRETSRQADMLEAAGDTEGAKAARRKLREQRRAYRDYSKEHGLAVHNDRLTVVKVRNGDTSYKNIYSSDLTDKGGSGIIKSGRDKMALEYQRYGRNKDTLVNKTYIDSGEYRRKFDNITDNPKVNKTLYDCAKAALKHRSGTEFEDMYWIDGDTGEIIKSALDEKEPRGVAYSDSINKAIRGRKNLVVMHTHPHSMPPSIADFNSAYSHNYSKAIILCHDGKIIQYNSTEKISSTLYDMYLQKFLSQGMADYDAQIKSLEKLKENHSIDFWEVE